MLSWDAIDLALQRLADLARADRRVRQEFENSRREFFADPAAARAPLAELRHLEWFLLERPSQVLGSIPALIWLGRKEAPEAAQENELGASFLQSIPGAFEVTSLVPAEGFWVRDLFTRSEHPVAEARALTEIEVGDLLVGRLYPAEGGSFMPSPSVSVFRSPALLSAVRRDLEGMRAVRRGVLRIQQLELEHLFHGRGFANVVSSQLDAEVRAHTRAELLRQGLEPDVVEEVLERILKGARSSRSQVITDVLNSLAFETGVDLAAVRLVLVDLWESERSLQVNGDGAVLGDASAASASRARAALEAFDRGRAEGKDLESLFRDLERDLGVENSGNEEEDASEEWQDASRDSGVIQAIVEEFLWEAGREVGAEQAGRWGVLRALGDYARDLTVFDELRTGRLLDFSSRWILDEGRLAGPAETIALLEALAAFCKWCEESHDLPLWSQFEATLGSLSNSLPRHVALRQCNRAGLGSGSYTVISIAEGTALVRDATGDEHSVEISTLQEAHLRGGDLVRLALEGGRIVLGATYPGELAASSSRSR